MSAMTDSKRVQAMLLAATKATDHHIYYRSLNRIAGFLAGYMRALHTPARYRAVVAEDMIAGMERELGPDLLGYGGRPIFPALRKRVAETLVELGY